MPIVTVTAVAGAERTRCPAGQSADCTFNVANTSGKSVRLSLEPRVEAPAQPGWFEIIGDVERDIPAAGNEQVRVRVHLPADAAAGKYSCKLRAYATDDPEQSADSPTVAIDVPGATAPAPPPPPPPNPFPWWIIAAVGGGLLVVGVVLAIVFWPSGIEVPDVGGKSLNDAVAMIEDSGLKVGEKSESSTGKVSVGHIAGQTPEPGAKVDKESTVALVVEAAPAKPEPKPEPKPVAIPDLSGIWSSNDGGLYYLSQGGKTLYWYGERSERDPVWSNVFAGQIEGDVIRGQWADVPKGRTKAHGEMHLKISAQGRTLTATHKTGGFGGSSWKRVGG